MADDSTPFQWGAGGARLTPDEIAQRRKDVAAAMLQNDGSKIFASGTRGAGGEATQGLAYLAKSAMIGMDAREANQASKANAADNTAMIAGLLGNARGSAPSAAPSAAPVVAASASPSALDPETSGYIKAAADKFGVDPAYLSRTAMIESGGKADATNPSGAAGLFQFMPKTAKEYGLDNPLDPEDSAMAAAELAKDNRAALAASLGRDPTNAELYLAHQQGAGGAAALLANPDASAAQAVGRQAVLQNGGTDGMTAGQFANQWLTKFGGGGPSPAVAQVAAAQAGGADPAALPAAAAPTQGYAVPGAAVAKVASGLSAVNPGVLRALTSPYADDATKKIAGIVLQQQMTPKEVHSQQTDTSGNMFDVNALTGEKKIVLKAGEDPTSIREYEYAKKNAPADQPFMSYPEWSDKKSRAAATNVTTNVDMNSGQTYDKQLAEGLGKSHAALANGVEDAQSRARDVAAMQGAVDQIQKNGGTTGGLAPEQRLTLQKSLNAGASALGFDKPFSEADISDKEFLTKFNRSMAGAQAKNAVGSRVTNFEMSNFLKANPGLDMSVTGNQRLLGIQGQIEQRNIAVGNAIREATAQAISGGKKIDPVTVQRIITDYDTAHHVQDPTTGQDLTQSYALPEFQQRGTNSSLAAGHETNVGKIRRYNPATGAIE